MTEFQPTTHEPHALHTLISWPAVLAGAIVAVAIGAMLNLLGVAIGAAALNPFSLSRDEADAFSVGAGVWVALANAVALFIGAFVASRAAKFTDHHRGMLQGLSVWALAFLMAIFIAGSTADGGLTAVLNGAAENAELDMADAPPPPIYYERDGPMVLVDPNNPPAGAVPPVQGDAGPAVPPPAQPAAEKTADATAQIALWAFLTMLLGVVGAIAGARYGAQRHPWESRMKLDDDTPRRPGPGGVS
ncbi:MAG: YrzE family protein [Caulobacter sp.]|nr:YrzE family protein [Caulobacter sp.]